MEGQLITTKPVGGLPDTAREQLERFMVSISCPTVSQCLNCTCATLSQYLNCTFATVSHSQSSRCHSISVSQSNWVTVSQYLNLAGAICAGCVWKEIKMSKNSQLWHLEKVRYKWSFGFTIPQDIYHELEKLEPEVNVLLTSGSELASKSQEPAAGTLRQSVQSLESKWDNITARANDRKVSRLTWTCSKGHISVSIKKCFMKSSMGLMNNVLISTLRHRSLFDGKCGKR